MTLTPPLPLHADHDLSLFDSGRPVLDDWLRRRAVKNESAGASRTYVVCEDALLVGYYCFATGSVEGRQTPGKVRRNMPDPIPVTVLARPYEEQPAAARYGLPPRPEQVVRETFCGT